jgi:small subunit ribosomal protein S17
MDKTIVVKVDVIKSHRKYKKVVRRSVKFHAHDETNSAHVGDTSASSRRARCRQRSAGA